MDNPFAGGTRTREGIRHEVGRRAVEECADGQLTPEALERCVDDAVAEFWSGRVATFVPLLALRRVRCCIKAGTCDRDDF